MMNGAGAVAVAAISFTTRAPAMNSTTAERWRWDWGVRSAQVGVPKAVLVARLLVVFTVHIAKKVVRTLLKADNQLSIHSTRRTSLSRL
jgi:hypothetical protein